MEDLEALYNAVRDDLQAVTDPVFEFGVSQVSEWGAFVPFGAILDGEGHVQLHAATREDEVTTSTELLPLLHAGLRQCLEADTRAVAACEWVTITPEGGEQTEAIKVLVEHANGLSVAFYLPMRKKLPRGWQCGEMMVMPASPEIEAWPRSPG